MQVKRENGEEQCNSQIALLRGKSLSQNRFQAKINIYKNLQIDQGNPNKQEIKTKKKEKKDTLINQNVLQNTRNNP